jgi:Glycosyl transferase family 2.
MPQVKEFIIPTRTADKVGAFLKENGLDAGVTLLPYEWTRGFNPSKALNMGVRAAKYDQIIITSPEVTPKTNVLEQLSEAIGQNIVCQVFDQNERGELHMSLVNKSFRNENPAMYFLAMFNKADIEAINGWDEDFMMGYAYEDNDFGARWMRAGLPFVVRDDIQAIHQYHPRGETIRGGTSTNFEKFNESNDKGVVCPKNGLNVI